MCMVWPCHNFVDGPSYKCIDVHKKVKLINHVCLPILMLSYMMLYIMLAYLMLFAALCDAVCLHNASSFFSIDFCKSFCYYAFHGLLTHNLFI